MNEPDARPAEASPDPLMFNEVQLLLAEKRTSLSTLRTGSAIFALPLSVLSVLVATSRAYDAQQVLHFLVPLALLNVLLIGLGSYLIYYSIRRVHHYDRLLLELKRRHSRLAELLD